MTAKDAQRFPLSASKSFHSVSLKVHEHTRVITSGMCPPRHTDMAKRWTRRIYVRSNN